MNPSSSDSYHASYLQYLVSLKSFDYEGALKAIHRYFDLEAVSSHNQSEFQYATLNLAILHFVFGHFETCKDSILETLRIALQNQDMVCVSQTISLLYKFAISSRDIPYAQGVLQRLLHTSIKEEILEMDLKSKTNWIDIASFLLETLDSDGPSVSARVEQFLGMANFFWISDNDMEAFQFIDNLTRSFNIDAQVFQKFGKGIPIDLSLQIEKVVSESSQGLSLSYEKMSLLSLFADESQMKGNFTLAYEVVNHITSAGFYREFPDIHSKILQIELSIALKSGKYNLAEEKILQIHSRILDRRAEFETFFELSASEVVLLVLRDSISEVIFFEVFRVTLLNEKIGV
jgi:hypothetical protein